MYKQIKFIIFCAVLLAAIGSPIATGSGLSFMAVPNAYAAAGCDPDDESCTDPALNCSPDDSDPDCDLVAKYINPMISFLSIFAGIAVTIGIIYGAIEYSSAGSDPGKVQKAKSHIRGAIIALLAFLLLWALLRWLQPGGGV